MASAFKWIGRSINKRIPARKPPIIRHSPASEDVRTVPFARIKIEFPEPSSFLDIIAHKNNLPRLFHLVDPTFNHLLDLGRDFQLFKDAERLEFQKQFLVNFYCCSYCVRLPWVSHNSDIELGLLKLCSFTGIYFHTKNKPKRFFPAIIFFLLQQKSLDRKVFLQVNLFSLSDFKTGIQN